jgi:hypothetical protein
MVAGTADNGATPFYVDASYVDVSGQPGVVGVAKPDITGGPDVVGSVVSTSIAIDASWSQLGAQIDAEGVNEHSGQVISLINSNTYGRVLAVGFPFRSNYKGYVRVFRYNVSSSSWSQLGSDIYGEYSNDFSGWSVSLVDMSGSIVDTIGNVVVASGSLVIAIGATGTLSIDNVAGHVRVYQYDASKTDAVTDQTSSDYGPVGWRRLGADIDGEADGDESGRSTWLVNSSAYGLVVAISAAATGGSVGSQRVYQYRQYTSADVGKYHHTSRLQNTTTQTKPLIITASNSTAPIAGTYYWMQVGFDIDRETSTDAAGWMISFVDSSAYGLVIAIGGMYNNGNGTNSGHARVYQYRQYTSADANIYHHTSRLQNTTTQTKPLIITASTSTAPVAGTYYWMQIGIDIDGEAARDNFGWSLSLADSSEYGLVVAIGAIENDGTNTTNTSDNRGHVRVYRYTGSVWSKLGGDIDGEATNDTSGRSVSLVNSSVGLVVAIGSRLGNERIYQYRQFTADMSGYYHYTSHVQNTTTQLKPLIITGDTFSAPTPGTYYWTQLGADFDVVGYYIVSLAETDDRLSLATRGSTVRVYEIPYTKTYSDVSGGYYDVLVVGGYLNDGLTSAALYVNGDTDLSGGLTVSGDVSFNAGNLFVAGDLSLNGNLFINSFAANSIGADAIDSTVDIEFANKLSVSTADLSFSTTGLQVATDFNANSAPTNLAANLTVPANIAIVDGSNGTVYGSYLTLTNKDATAYYNVGKSASGIFNIVDQASAGVYLASGGTSFTGTSDARLKTNIAPLESATDKIMALNPCTYQWKSEVESAAADNTSTNTKPHVGFIAQEVEKIMPELVHSIDHPAGPDYKGVNTTDMIPYLIRTIQEQTATMNALESRLETLKQSRMARK